MSCLIVFRSLTHTQRAAALLRKSGVSVTLVKPPTALGRGSCAHGLVIPNHSLPQTLQLLQKTSIIPLGVYESRNGSWREVVL